MFTGLITALGRVAALERAPGLVRMRIESPYDASDMAIGASIAHAGCCLTIVAKEAQVHGMAPKGMLHVVEVAQESLDKTSLGRLQVGDSVNLERSLKAGDELGGHIVSGHVDGLGEVQAVTQDGAGWRISIKAPDELAALIAPKGSIAVDGVSLTVNEVEGAVFGVLIIPHTWTATTLSRLKAGDVVNLEADVLARYAARYLSMRS
jgi:riboflavin synthase